MQRLARWLPLFFLLHLSPEVLAETRDHTTATHQPVAKLAIVIDDLGYQAMPGTLAQLPAEISVAILPNTPYATRVHAQAKQQQRDILLHMPMEPSRPAPLEPNTLMRSMGKATVQATLRQALAQLPDAFAINNHMGSAFTQDAQATGWVMEVLAQQHLAFLDSRTTPHSRAGQQARAHQVATLNRHIFLDHERTASFVHQQLQRAVQRAQRHGYAIAIGHPYPVTLNTLQQWLARQPQHDVTLVKLSALYPPHPVASHLTASPPSASHSDAEQTVTAGSASTSDPAHIATRTTVKNNV